MAAIRNLVGQGNVVVFPNSFRHKTANVERSNLRLFLLAVFPQFEMEKYALPEAVNVADEASSYSYAQTDEWGQHRYQHNFDNMRMTMYD